MHQLLLDLLAPTMLDVGRASLERHADEHFYCVALYTSGEYRYLVDSISTTEALEKVAKKYLTDKTYQDNWVTLDVAMRELKWSPCDSLYHCEFDGKFPPISEVLDSIWQTVDLDSDDEYINTCKAIHETCIAALSKIQNSGLFDKDQVVFNLLMGDQSDEQRLLNAEVLNSEGVVNRFRRELEIDEHELEKLKKSRVILLKS
jgi:Domain of unknown function (DUF4303)